jgi:nicotinate-nucleotide--dimethylbenzimidazole phosphoribosyltransferase
MSDDRWSTALVLGGIRSGKSAFAEALVADAPSVRYVATAAGGEDDPEWLARIEAHQQRRPQTWSTEETGADPGRLTALLAEAKPDDTLLVDDLGGWVTGLLDPARQPNNDEADVAALAAAVRGCAARVVLVSPEVGLALVPATPVGRAFADALGSTNQALAEVCDRVALVVAGQSVWLKGGLSNKKDKSGGEATDLAAALPLVDATPDPELEPHLVAPAASDRGPAAPPAVLDEPTMLLPVLGSGVTIEPGMQIPLPDGDAGPDARDRLVNVDFAGAGLGALAGVVEFAAATQGTTTPRPWSSVRVLLISGSHAGGVAAGDDPADAERRIAEVEQGEGVLSQLAGEAGADIAVLRMGTSGALEDGPVLDEAAVDVALRQGWRLAEAAADAGRDLLVLASIGVGTDAVATAISAAVTGSEPVAALPRVLRPGGTINDDAWMVRCAAVRDALHRIRQESRGSRDILIQLGGADFAVATGALLGAAFRRLPVLLDGPVGVAAGLVARDLASQVRHWCLLPDTGNLTLVRHASDVLGLAPMLELGLGLGEGANALAALPLLRSAIALAAAVPVHPALLAEQDVPDADAPADLDPAGSDDASGDAEEAEEAEPALPTGNADPTPAELDATITDDTAAPPADLDAPTSDNVRDPVPQPANLDATNSDDAQAEPPPADLDATNSDDAQAEPPPADLDATTTAGAQAEPPSADLAATTGPEAGDTTTAEADSPPAANAANAVRTADGDTEGTKIIRRKPASDDARAGE